MSTLSDYRHDGWFVQDSAPAPGHGFVTLAERILKAHPTEPTKLDEAIRFLHQAAILGVPSAFQRLTELSRPARRRRASIE